MKEKDYTYGELTMLKEDLREKKFAKSEIGLALNSRMTPFPRKMVIISTPNLTA